MNAWYYRQADQEVGPFQLEVLEKLRRAGVIDDATPVKGGSEEGWQALSEALDRASPAAQGSNPGAARYHYLDASDQTVGPFDIGTLRRLYTEGVLGADTLVSGIGDAQWVPASSLLGTPASRSLATVHGGADAQQFHPRHRSPEQFALMMVFTLTFYLFYLVPSQSRDIKAITGKERLDFTALLVLGIVTLSLLLLVMMVLWAYDLERHGREVNKAGRLESLGTTVLALNAIGVVLSFAISDFVLSFLVGSVLTGCALWLLQKEINLYAFSPDNASA